MNKLEALKIMKEVEKYIKDFNLYEAIRKMQYIEFNYTYTEYSLRYIESDRINEVINNENWERVACILSDIITRLNDEMYELQDDGNLTWIKLNSVKKVYEDILEAIEDMED